MREPPADITEFMTARFSEAKQSAERRRALAARLRDHDDEAVRAAANELENAARDLLAETEAHRKVLRYARLAYRHHTDDWLSGQMFALFTLAAFASAHAGHPDCKEKWLL